MLNFYVYCHPQWSYLNPKLTNVLHLGNTGLLSLIVWPQASVPNAFFPTPFSSFSVIKIQAGSRFCFSSVLHNSFLGVLFHMRLYICEHKSHYFTLHCKLQFMLWKDQQGIYCMLLELDFYMLHSQIWILYSHGTLILDSQVVSKDTSLL